MRKMRSISLRMRNIISNLGALFLLLLDIDLGEFDEVLTFSVHHRVVFIPHLVANAILDMRHSCIQVCTSFILNLLIFNALLLPFERLSFV
jgi:hypothetical protein